MKRQGDLVFKKITELPKNLKRVTGGVILKGESTGHSHRLIGGDVLKDKAGLLFLVVGSKGSVVHEEHKTINLAKGNYAVIRQREYTMNDMTRLVID